MPEEMSRQERIGFHKGALDTLVKERQELMKLVSITSKLIEMHVSGLKELGIDLTKQVQAAKEQTQPQIQPQKQSKAKPAKKKKDDFGDFY